MSRTTMRAKGQITLPDDVRRAAHLEEGDLLEAEITAEGILLRPQKFIDATQAWFWNSEWQSGEREAEGGGSGGRGASGAASCLLHRPQRTPATQPRCRGSATGQCSVLEQPPARLR